MTLPQVDFRQNDSHLSRAGVDGKPLTVKESWASVVEVLPSYSYFYSDFCLGEQFQFEEMLKTKGNREFGAGEGNRTLVIANPILGKSAGGHLSGIV
jgi:hypothetical protein